jgi:hypothetical protein
MQLANIQWSQNEQDIAQAALTVAQQRESMALMREVGDRVQAITKLEDLWVLHDFLSARRHEIEGKYVFEPISLIFVFAQLVKEGWLQLADLTGLEPDKQTKIGALARM